MFKRIFLFVAMNIAFMVSITLCIFVLEMFTGIRISGNLSSGYISLGIYSLVVGFASAFLSLATSRMIAKWTYPMELVVPERLIDYDTKVQLVYSLVDTLRKKEGIEMPEVGVYQDAEPNAFATGPTKNRALIAVSSGLLDTMTQKEIEGVVGHEMAHVINGDMVTMTLLQGVMNAITIFASRILSEIVASAVAKSETQHFWIRMALTLVFEIVFGFFSMIVLAYFSRIREYKADEQSAKYVGKSSMIASLKKLQGLHESGNYADSAKDTAVSTMQISTYKISRLFSTHPPLEERVKALEERYDIA